MSCRDRCHFLDGIAVRGDAQGLGLTMEGEVISRLWWRLRPGRCCPQPVGPAAGTIAGAKVPRTLNAKINEIAEGYRCCPRMSKRQSTHTAMNMLISLIHVKIYGRGSAVAVKGFQGQAFHSRP